MALINGYKRLTYLQGNSSSTYINTGINPSNLIKVDITQYATMGITIGSTNNGTGWLNSIGCSSAQAWYYSGEYNVVRFSNEAINNIIISPTTSEIIVNGTSYSKPHYTFSRNSPMLMFALRDGSSVDYYSDAKVYSCKIWNDGTLVRDFIPVERESDNVLGLYDLVNNVFYTNAGSGTFIKGDYYLETHVVPEGKGTITDETGYEGLDYIYSGGTQYINTNFYPSNNTKILLDYYLISSSGNAPAMFGCSDSGFTNAYEMYCYSTNFYSIYGNNQQGSYFTQTNGTFYKVEIDNNVWKVNNQEHTFTANTFTSSYPLYLGAVNRAGSLYAQGGTYRIYGCKIYENNVLVRDYIPAKRKSDNAVGLLDKENMEFYPSVVSVYGYGSILGDYHKLTAIKKATTKFNNWLVNGYTQLDYIESSGTQYIDTLYQSNNTSRFVCEYKLNEVINTNYSNCIFGNTFNINDGYGSTYSLTFNNTSYLHSGYGQSNVNVTNDAISKDIVNSHIVDFNRNILKIDGTTITTHTSTTFNSNKNIYIFKSYSTSSSVQGWAKINIYNFKIYDNDILIRDFIPVIRHIDGQIGLLDLVHFKFYENKGTGVFQGGSVVEV